MNFRNLLPISCHFLLVDRGCAVVSFQNSKPEPRPWPAGKAKWVWPTPDPAGRTVREVPGALRYWACPAATKVNPTTGNRLADGYAASGADDYKKANVVWNAAAERTFKLAAIDALGRDVCEALPEQVRTERMWAGMSSGPSML